MYSVLLGPFLMVRRKGLGVSVVVPGVHATADIHPFPIIKSSNIFGPGFHGSPAARRPQLFLTRQGDVFGASRSVSGGQ